MSGSMSLEVNPPGQRPVTNLSFWTGLDNIEKLVFMGILVSLLMQVWLIIHAEVNWDEFAYLAKVYEFQSGTLNRALQTAHVYLFYWVPFLSTSEVVQVEYARLVMLLLQVGTLFCIYLVSCKFVSQRSALFATLLYGCAGATILHGSSFRADPIAAFLMMLSIYWLSRTKLNHWHCIGSGTAIALAGLITVKSVFYLPALIAIGLWQAFRSRHVYSTMTRFVLTAIGTIALFLGLYVLHESNLPSADLDGSKTMMASAANTTLLRFEFLPRSYDIFSEFSRAYVAGGFVIAGLIFALFRLRLNRISKEWVILGLALPLVSLLFYGNAYPYFFPFVFPPAMVLTGYAVDHLNIGRKVLGVVTIVVIASACWTTGLRTEKDKQSQKDLIDAVHRVFPEPVNYIDRNSMVSSFPKHGFFMSRWGLSEYRKLNKPIFPSILKTHVVPMLILNSPTLEHAVGLESSEPPLAPLFEQDRSILAQSYIPYWGKLWIAGKEVEVNSVPRDFIVNIPGNYRIETVAPVSVDNRKVGDGEIVILSRGKHQIRGDEQFVVKLKWADAHEAPARKPSNKPVYMGF